MTTPLPKVAVVYGTINFESQADNLAVLGDVEEVADALRELGYDPICFGATLNLDELLEKIKEINPLFVFNMVESLGGFDSLQHFVPALLDAHQIAYTGVSTQSLFCTTDKLMTKELLRAHNLPTARSQRCDDIATSGLKLPFPIIIKPVAAEASIGMDELCVCVDAAALERKMATIPPASLNTMFAEQYIDGREFNISMLSTGEKVEVLHPAEMTFIDFPPEKPKIVDFRAKWVEDTFEYDHTSRTFDYPDSDQPLLARLKTLCQECQRVFNLDGYARVDLRVDQEGNPWILEINGNPCISSDAGIAAAAEYMGISYTDLIGKIVAHTLRKREALHPA